MTAAGAHAGPLDGVRVLEVAVGVSDLGLGHAGGVPGRLFADLGATVTRVVGPAAPIDAEVSWGRVWHRGKEVVAAAGPDEIRRLLLEADVAFVYGSEAVVERRGLGWADLGAAHPTLVYARCRPSRTATGDVDDQALLVEARAGFCTQLAAHRDGPMLVDVRASSTGAAFVLTASALALLLRRELEGTGGWAETSLYDGLLATLGCMIGRSERAAPKIESYWAEGSFFPNFLYRCGDGELLQIWFGGKGMYDRVIEVLGDEPSTDGYYAEQTSGLLQDRARRWHEVFPTQRREVWIDRLRGAGVACEPVLAPGEALADPHLAEIGLAVRAGDADHGGEPGDVVVGSPIAVHPFTDASASVGDGVGSGGIEAGSGDGPGDGDRSGGIGVGSGDGDGNGGAPHGGRLDALVAQDPDAASSPMDEAGNRTTSVSAPGGRGLLDGVRVVDFSAFVAGPLAAEVLADLGADVVKVEPPAGEAMRAAAYAIAACQRGKRSVALDITDPAARPIVESLLRVADVVLHNFRVGVAERLGIDADTVAALNPGAVHCHASAFGSRGPRATYPGNDALMQAVTGFEVANGGEGNDPTAATWIPVDMSGGWIAAAGILAGLVARARTGRGQRVETSLLGAGMLLHGGVFLRDGRVVRGPALDADQTGYGPGYRLYRCAGETWLAVVIPDPAAWDALRSSVAPDLPPTYAPVRGGVSDDDARKAEAVLERAFAARPATEWTTRLPTLGVLCEVVEDVGRDAFRRRILDDPVNRQLGRAVSYETADWGGFEQIGPLLRCGPDAEGGPSLHLPGVGEHTVEVLTELGRTPDEIDALLSDDVARQSP
ncbi:MAG TPA: CoA transferase [Acidimicrobiales bacterium]|nr:CoA transferase [Acidimicrobiales bacterium]